MSPTANHPRYLCSELVTVLYEDSRSATRGMHANLEAIAADSATILCDHKLEPGTPISFNAKDQDLYGVVDSCERDEALGWFVEIRLHPRSRWSGRRFVPEHFLALSMPARKPEATPAAVPAKAFTLRRRSGY